MKPINLLAGLACTAFTSAAMADTQRLSIEAPVVSVSPVVRTVTDKIPHQSCWNERVRVESRRGHHSAVPQVLGAVIGGAAGGALGDSSGHKSEVAVAGALLGAALGHDAAHRRSSGHRYVTEERCEIDYELRDREVVMGYRVGYEYEGAVYYTRMPREPGPTIRVGVILDPEGQ